MNKNLIIAFLFLLFVGGCATAKPMVQMEKDISLTGYKSFEIIPVINETGKTFEFDVADHLTQHIKSKIKDKGYIINKGKEAKDSILVIESSLITYEPGSAVKRWLLPGLGKTRATVRTSLIDKMTGKTIGEIVTAEEVGAGGFFSVGADKWILEVIAKGISNEIDKRIKGD